MMTMMKGRRTLRIRGDDDDNKRKKNLKNLMMTMRKGRRN
jgi:hypothetical protein